MKEVKKISNRLVNGNIVDHLEEMLESAKSGDLTGIILIDKHYDKTIGYCHSGDVCREMIAEMEAIKFTFFCKLNGVEFE